MIGSKRKIPSLAAPQEMAHPVTGVWRYKNLDFIPVRNVNLTFFTCLGSCDLTRSQADHPGWLKPLRHQRKLPPEMYNV